MDSTYLTNQFLIAMPAMGDPNFDHTVTFICEHNADGALGLVINRPMGMQLADILGQMSLEAEDEAVGNTPVLRGGPVQPERGFVIHDMAGEWSSSFQVGGEIHVTTSRDILAAMAEGGGPERVLVVLGYAGWGAGQLEAEMAANAWLTVPASSEILFEIPFDERWREAARLIGIDMDRLSSEAGHA